VKYRQFGIPKLITILALVAVFAMAVRVPISPDMWWHLRCGEVQWRTRQVLRTDVFSHTAQGTPWVNQSWLPQLVMYGMYAVGGFPALAIAVAVLVTVAFGFTLFAMRTEGRYGYIWRAFVTIWAAISTSTVWAARPHLITFVFTAVWVYILDQQRRKSSANIGHLWSLPPLMLLWANCHGGYIVGFILLGTEIAGCVVSDLWHRRLAVWSRLYILIIVTLLCILAAAFNPQGIRLLIFPFQTLSSYAQQGLVSEWASPDFHTAEMLVFLALLLATWSALPFSSSKTTGVEWVRLLGFTVMALRSGRYIGLCVLVAAPLLFKHGHLAMTRLAINWGKRPSIIPPARGLPTLNWAILTLVLIGAGTKVVAPLNVQTIARIHRKGFPVEAVAYMRDHDLPPTLFNDYGWGGYLIWALYPGTPVFIDGRADPYGDALIESYHQIISARPGWDERLKEHQVNTAIIRADDPLASVMQGCPEWQPVYKDALAIIFCRFTIDNASIQ
jgi:hypothetical protein